MSTSTHYAHQHVVWHFVRQEFEAEMERQRLRQQEEAKLLAVGKPGTASRRWLVLSADGSWAHTGHSSRQFTYVVQDVTRDLHTIRRETEEQREQRLKGGRPRPPVVYGRHR